MCGVNKSNGLGGKHLPVNKRRIVSCKTHVLLLPLTIMSPLDCFLASSLFFNGSCLTESHIAPWCHDYTVQQLTLFKIHFTHAKKANCVLAYGGCVPASVCNHLTDKKTHGKTMTLGTHFYNLT